jgi:hypothetical protein
VIHGQAGYLRDVLHRPVYGDGQFAVLLASFVQSQTTATERVREDPHQIHTHTHTRTNGHHGHWKGTHSCVYVDGWGDPTACQQQLPVRRLSSLRRRPSRSGTATPIARQVRVEKLRQPVGARRE